MCYESVTERGVALVDDEILGPIDYLAVEWPGGHVTGEGFELLLDLTQRGIVRVLDLEFITKAADGTALGVVDRPRVHQFQPAWLSGQ